jgi:type VI secretion system protein VasD
MMLRDDAFSRAVALAGLVALGGCKGCKKDEFTCNPDDEVFELINVVVQPSETLNPDEEGNPLSVQLRIYQLKGEESLELIDFETVWHKGGKEAFGDDYIAEEEVTIYPGRPHHLELKPEADLKFVVAAAIFGDPIGQDWFRVWEVPRYHGQSVCNAKRKKKPWPDPCFHVMLDRYAIDGGHTPPAGWDPSKSPVQCPGAPMTTPPPEVPEDDGKKKKKKKGKGLKDAKVPEQPEQPAAPEAPAAPGG